MNILNYNTIILDLDFTIWNGYQPKFWAKLLSFPYALENNKIYDIEKKYIEFHDGIFDVLNILRNNNINVGFLSVGGIPNIHFESQPSIICMRMYGIFNHFNYKNFIGYKTEIKSKHIIPHGKTLFIDDTEENLIDIRTNCPSIDTLNRNQFDKWKDLV